LRANAWPHPAVSQSSRNRETVIGADQSALLSICYVVRGLTKVEVSYGGWPAQMMVADDRGSEPGATPKSPGQTFMTISLLVKSVLIAILALSVAIVLVYGAVILIPLAVALLLWMFINALARMFQRLWSGWFGPLRLLSLALAFLTLLVASLIVVQIIAVNVSEISARTSDFERSLGILVDKVAELTGLSNDRIINAVVSHLSVEQLLGAIVVGVAGVASHVGVVFVFIIFLLVEQQFFDMKLNALVADEGRRQRIRSMLARIAHDVQTYLWTVSVASLLTAALSYIVMILAGLDNAPFWAFLIFVLNFIPTVGSILGIAIPSLYALLQFGEFSPFLVLAVTLGLVQFVVGNIIQPRMMAKSLNLSQFAVILALFVLGAIWGIAGMLLAVPITVVAMIVCSHFPQTRGLAVMSSESGDPGPEQRSP
jgi:AI-2 transport protein TqsA